MDNNTIVEVALEKSSTFEEKLPTLSVQNSTSDNAFAKQRSDLQKEALLAIKRDPAVLEAKLTIKPDPDVLKTREALNALKALQIPRKSQEFQLEASQTPSSKSQEFQAGNSTPESSRRLDFNSKMCMERAALLSLSAPQFSLILKYVAILRQQRMSMQRQIECAFCMNNKQPEVWYTTHTLRDSRGRVRCPVLRAFHCPRCGATGDRAHTVTHCPTVRRR